MSQDQKTERYQHIGDIANKLGVSSRSIRYYEELGLIIPNRSNGGFREYSDFEVDKLTTIIKLKKLGLSLEEIQNLVKMKQCIDGKKSASDLLQYLHGRLHEFEEKIKDYREGIKEIKKFIATIDECAECREEAEVFKCKQCFEEQDKEMPQMMKALL